LILKILAKFRSIPRTFVSAQKQHHGSSAENSVSPGLVSFKSCKLESKTRGKALGKVDTLETYQSSPTIRLAYDLLDLFPFLSFIPFLFIATRK